MIMIRWFHSYIHLSTLFQIFHYIRQVFGYKFDTFIVQLTMIWHKTISDIYVFVHACMHINRIMHVKLLVLINTFVAENI